MEVRFCLVLVKGIEVRNENFPGVCLGDGYIGSCIKRRQSGGVDSC